MLTDRQIVALELLKHTVGTSVEIIRMARNVGETKKIVNDTLTIADIFLQVSDPNATKHEEIAQKMQANNQRLQELVNKILLNRVDKIHLNESESVEIEEGVIAWIDGQPVYVVEG